ncbi:unnamed protein product, partial [Cladocopium goreaui]
FTCGAAVTLSGQLPERFIRAKVAMSEFNFLQAVKQAIRAIGNGQGTELDGITLHAAGHQALPYRQLCQAASDPPDSTEKLSVALRRLALASCDALVVHLPPLPAKVAVSAVASMVVLPRGARTVVEVISIFQSGFMGAPATSGALLLDEIFEVRQIRSSAGK